MGNVNHTKVNIKDKKKISKKNLKEWGYAYLFLLPMLVFFITFVVYPMIKGVYISFFDYSLRNFKFIGLENYKSLVHDKIFLKSLGNTLLIVLANVPLVMLLSLFVSVVIYKKSPKIRSFFRGVFYLPTVASVVSITVVWGWIFHPSYGILNYLISKIGVEPKGWLGDPKYALICIIIVLVTLSVGQPIILYVAALGNVPTSYLEAAEVDGATPFEIFRKVTWPLLMPTTLYIVIITTINSFQCFSIIQLLTSGGPAYSTSTIMYMVYERAFTLNKYGLASAMGVILAIIIMIISVVQFKFFGEEVDY
ncbi:carbohydrate ABC transporter permease [Clostridium algidicarnis]|uniref:Sugar ABC transporter permease n=1 Tax=Clostridium algidicarnis TaxID=37659 RepID=A0ABS6C5Z3_9CLOT|nr:sugar ABC transporter permease [Clostridium algidicarnis]MBU3194887.1 sugar ABC transporter permease [Clostridium algidicarnis]MBU3197562.1 sugar ABC transporter permease [Clostridium algidicarnis]MBU3205299.1 sugar ABC transporter permease [Clostridium algidicarnis]MBU3210676.1 sugar ABC transporter permease [Clostridium algidicarnis]MBU3213452.1 sugar ABC transporter permease [Clostridium algidicarnis]